MKSVQSTMVDNRIKRVSGNLYECRADGVICQHRLTFGFGLYCSWLLGESSRGLVSELPCLPVAEELKCGTFI